ncbi:MAG: YbjN domain-containing protein [Candidatus Omnitrophica bacterium]|nr:YbjN domain-containing protein [Candidatus Omnitrophota bacterium]
MNSVIARVKEHLEDRGLTNVTSKTEDTLAFQTRTSSGLAFVMVTSRETSLAVLASFGIDVSSDRKCDVLEFLNSVNAVLARGFFVIASDRVYFRLSMPFQSEMELTDERLEQELFGPTFAINDFFHPGLLMVLHGKMSPQEASDAVLSSQEKEPTDTFLNRN